MSLRNTLGKLATISGHPLLILLIGTMLTSLLIPYIANNINQKSFLQQERFKKAVALLDSNSLVDRRFNTLLTALESFDSRAPTMLKDWKLHQRELRATADGLYREIDSHVWWWYQYLDVEALLLKLPPSRLPPLSAVVGRYRENLVNVTSLIHSYGGHLLSDGYSPSSRSNERRRNQTRQHFSSLEVERDQIAREMAYLFLLP